MDPGKHKWIPHVVAFTVAQVSFFVQTRTTREDPRLLDPGMHKGLHRLLH